MILLHMCCMLVNAYTHSLNFTHYFDKRKGLILMKIHFAYCNQYKNGIDIAFC